jgi:hypothetical protein
MCYHCSASRHYEHQKARTAQQYSSGRIDWKEMNFLLYSREIAGIHIDFETCYFM